MIDPDKRVLARHRAAAYLSQRQAIRLAQVGNGIEMRRFMAALRLRRPVPATVAAALLEHVIMDSIEDDVEAIAHRMRMDRWDQFLESGEDLETVAGRVQQFFSGEDGVAMLSFFVKTFARASDSIYRV